MKHCFIVTSAVNSRFGVYSPAERLQQTLDTVASIRAHVPDSEVVIMEVTGADLHPDQAQALENACDIFIDLTDEPDVRNMYTSTDNWDIVKNGTEIMCFGRALKLLKESGDLDNYDRIHKMSGRYVINDLFDPDMYTQSDVVNKIVIGRKHKSQFPVEITTQPWQYMARLWSWPKALNDEIINVYDRSFACFIERVNAGGYIDIEHVLAKFLNQEHVHEIDSVGVEGNIAPNGHSIKN
jgi:hypothetical protein